MVMVRKKMVSPGRIQQGAAILAACRLIDSRKFNDRLTPFAQAQKACVDAQTAVDTADAKLRAVQAQVAECDLDVRELVDQLARLLVMDGAPLKNPFGKFDVPAPLTFAKLPSLEKAAAVHRLVAALPRDKSVGKETLKAAQAADKLAAIVEKTAVPLAALETAARDARHARDALAESWETARASLSRQVRFLDADGIPGLYASVFGRPVAKKKPAPAATTAPSAPAPPAQA